jgi:hypothetical protein
VAVSVTISTHQSIVIPTDDPLVRVDVSTGEVFIWLGGVGIGPLITMPLADWYVVADSVEIARMVAMNNRDQAKEE